MTEDDVGDAFALRKGDEPLFGTPRLHAHDCRAKALSEQDVLCEGLGVLCGHSPGLLIRRLDIHGVPLGTEAAGDARAGPEDARR